MDLYLVRHAQSANNANLPDERVHDAPITQIGERQCAYLAHWSKSAGVSRLLVSPMLRTLQTVHYVRETLDLIPEVWGELHEQGGCISGSTAAAYEGQPRFSNASHATGCHQKSMAGAGGNHDLTRDPRRRRSGQVTWRTASDLISVTQMKPCSA